MRVDSARAADEEAACGVASPPCLEEQLQPMQRSMVELLLDVQARASDLGTDREKETHAGIGGVGERKVRPQTTSWNPGDAARHAAQARILGLSLASPRGEAAQGGRATTADARFRPWCWARERRPLGEALRQDRENLKSQEQQSMLGVLSTGDFAASLGACPSQALAIPSPSIPRCGAPGAYAVPPPSAGALPSSRGGGASYACGPRRKRNGQCAVRVVHRHHHHHYHHHYFPDAGDDAAALDAPLGGDDLPAGSQNALGAETTLLPGGNVLFPGDSLLQYHNYAVEGGGAREQVTASREATRGQGAATKRHEEEHRHLHHHHHAGEQGIPARARRLLDDARFAAAAAEAAKNGAAAADGANESVGRRGGPDPRLPRLA